MTRFARKPSPQPLPRERGGSHPRVALFRERGDANASAARLRRFGFSVVCLPVIEIRTGLVRPQRARYDAVVATSDKAFHAEGPTDTSSPLYVVGARTARAAEARGWRLASPPARDADELITKLAGALKAGASVLYLAGRDRKEAIEAALAETFELEVVEAYAAEAREAWRPAEAAVSRILRRGAALFAPVGRAGGSAVEDWRARRLVSLSLSTFACRATLQNHCEQSAQSASRLPKRLMKRGFFEGCAKSSAGSLRAGRPVYRAREKPRARGDGRRGNKGRFRWANGRSGQS